MNRPRLWAALFTALLLVAGCKDFFHPEGPTRIIEPPLTDEQAADEFKETLKEALAINAVAINLDVSAEDLVDLAVKIDEALAAYDKLSQGARSALSAEKARLDAAKEKIGHVNSARQFQVGHRAVLEKQAEDVNTMEDVAALLPGLEKALEAYETLPEPVKELLKDHGTLLGSLKAKADEIIEASKPVIVTISFDSHEGSPVEAITGNMGTQVNAPADPKRAGYTFLGWFDAETGGALYNWPHTLAGDLTMHAYWQDDTLPPPPQYTITFDSHGGSVAAAITANEGTPVKEPVEPLRDGYRFLGWFPTESGGTKYDWPHTLSGDVTMHAQWVRQHTISFESHGGSPVPDAITADTGTAVKKPDDPARNDGYTFTGWFDAASGGAPYTWPHTLTADVTMHAQWQDDTLPPPPQYTITFESHGGSPVPDAITADEGTKVDEPVEPVRNDGYTFTGWFSAASGGALYAWPHELTESLTMHAQWQDDTLPPPVQYTITFNSHGGLPVPDTVTANTGTEVKKPAEPTRTGGYRFLGWFSEASAGTEYTAWPHTLAGDVTMHAQWVRQHTITFETYGGSAVEAITADTGAKVPKPADPKRADYDFAGWFDAENGDALYSWPYTLTGNVTMHAQWKPKVSFEVTVKDQDGDILDLADKITISKSGSETSFTATVSSGYEVVQWYLNGGPLGGAGESMTINAKDYTTGKYYLGVSVKKGGAYYSTDIYFTVED
jgi:uncharacterized repeat protein (TIGR02543 family)